MTLSTRLSVPLVLCGALVAGAAAAADAEDVIKYRQASMKALGGHATAMAQIVRGKVAFPARLEGHAQAAAALTRDLPALFPAGSDFGETDAKPEIWSKRAEFEKVSGDSSKAADALVTAVRSGDSAAVGKAFDALSQTCKGCHEDFRVKK
ncbi:MAG: cytochrome c [Gammaproteobacteria bacterium]|jgi:cytochrome c556|nr:cytochrome c [Gammaproteobacteria bacterium]